MNSFEALEKIVQLKTMGQAYIFAGPDESILKEAGKKFTQLLNVQNEDLIELNLNGEEIKIDNIRELRRKFILSPLFSPIKAVIIHNAERMNNESANALLETLEEPKGQAIIILLTSLPRSLLPTLLSRCQIINFFRQPADKLKIDVSIRYDDEYLEELSKEDKETILRVLNNWLLVFRQKFLESRDPKTALFLKKLINASFNIQTTNINTRLALEALILDL